MQHVLLSCYFCHRRQQFIFPVSQETFGSHRSWFFFSRFKVYLIWCILFKILCLDSLSCCPFVWLWVLLRQNQEHYRSQWHHHHRMNDGVVLSSRSESFLRQQEVSEIFLDTFSNSDSGWLGAELLCCENS